MVPAGTMREPLNLRLSTVDNPSRGDLFERTLERRGANAAIVIRGLVDAYNESDGMVDFPVLLVPKNGHSKSKHSAGKKRT